MEKGVAHKMLRFVQPQEKLMVEWRSLWVLLYTVALWASFSDWRIDGAPGVKFG